MISFRFTSWQNPHYKKKNIILYVDISAQVIPEEHSFAPILPKYF